MLKVLEVFHNRPVKRIVWMTTRRKISREWERPSLSDALETIGL